MKTKVNAKTEKEDWMQKKWRPMMAILYMSVCSFDFIIAPVLWSVIQAIGNGGHIASQWQPLTLQGAGLLHLSFGAILGVAAYGRTQEKLAGTASNTETAYQPPATFNAPAPTSFPQPSPVPTPTPTPSFSPAQSFSPAPAATFVSKQGKPGPIIEEPEL